MSVLVTETLTGAEEHVPQTSTNTLRWTREIIFTLSSSGVRVETHVLNIRRPWGKKWDLKITLLARKNVSISTACRYMYNPHLPCSLKLIVL